LESFTKRSDRYFFHKLSKRYAERDILDYLIYWIILLVILLLMAISGLVML
jgi:thiosulfate reductase cytochrome b subunit